MKRLLAVFFLTVLFFAPPSFALVGAGAYSNFVHDQQVDKTGGRNNFNFSPFVEFSHHFGPIFEELPKFFLRPGIGLVDNRDENYGYEKRTYFALFHGVYFFSSELVALVGGTGLFITEIKGIGGTRVVRNGNSSSNFYLPSSNPSFAYNTTVDLGMEFFLHKHLAMEAMGFVFSLLDKERRSYSYALSFHYFL